MKNRNVNVEFILCFFLGYFGIHKFYKGDSKLGFIYLFTFGIFGLGWIIDLIILFIQLLSYTNNTKNDKVSSILDNNINLSNGNFNQNNHYKKYTNKRFDFISDNKILKYSYYDINVRGIEYLNFDINNINIDDNIEFEFEPNNQYDNHAIKIICNNTFIGYIPKNNLQEMVQTYLIRKNKYIKSFVSFIDKENKLIQIAIGFYQIIDSDDIFNELNHIDTTLIKTTKKDFLDNSRQENLENVSEKDELNIEYQYDTETYLVTDDCGYELGEINKNISEKLEQYENEGKTFHIFVKSIKYTDSDKINCKIRIYI